MMSSHHSQVRAALKEYEEIKASGMLGAEDKLCVTLDKIYTEREQELKEALEDMLWQFAYRFDGAAKRPPTLGTGGLSALEYAFSVLGWDDPKECPDSSCDMQGCQKWPGSGNPLPNGDYWSLCTDHMMMLNDNPKNYLYMAKKRGRGYNAKERAERLARR